MKAAELNAKTAEQLKEILVSLKKDAMNLRFQQSSGELEDTSKIEKARKNIARVKTILNQKVGAENA